MTHKGRATGAPLFASLASDAKAMAEDAKQEKAQKQEAVAAAKPEAAEEKKAE